MLRTIQQTIDNLTGPVVPRLSPPTYTGPKDDHRMKVGLAVLSMKDHTSNEGYQIFQGLEHNDYTLAGYGYTTLSRSHKYEGKKRQNLTNINEILDFTDPSTVVVQDKREWDVRPRDFRDKRANFLNVTSLASRSDIFKLTIVKDAQHNPVYHSYSAQEIGCHAWIIYYHPRIVAHLASYIRPQHIIRTYHTINPENVPTDLFLSGKSDGSRDGCLLSGAVSSAYPLRTRLVNDLSSLYKTTYLHHPGYHRNGSHTPEYIRLLTKYKVAICTASVYGYALRKLIEGTAAGCVVITDLPVDEVIPGIDDNLIRISSDTPTSDISEIVAHYIDTYNPDRQYYFSQEAIKHYDYKVVTAQLARDIEVMRKNYGGTL